MAAYTMNNRSLGSGTGLLLGCLLCFAGSSSHAQNLVPNPSMEENTACPVTIGFQGFSKPLYWEKWNQSPEYFNACAGSLGGVDTMLRVPLNGFGFQYPMHGDAYMGMAAFGTSGGGVNFREYVGCELLQPLEVGESYDLSFFTNVAFGGNYWAPTWACNNMGMLFTMQPNIWTDLNGPPFALRNYAHLRSSAIISDTANWTLVSGSFVADSAYQYLVIGNFFSNALTDTLHVIPGNSLGAYYFVDGVCVRKTGQPCEFITGIEEPVAEGPVLFPNPAQNELVVSQRAGAEAQVLDAMGRLLRQGRIPGDRWVLDVASWARGAYVLRIAHRGQVESHTFVLTDR